MLIVPVFHSFAWKMDCCPAYAKSKRAVTTEPQTGALPLADTLGAAEVAD
jgi:hypothetical protein